MTKGLDVWFREVHKDGIAVGVRVTGYPYTAQTPFQRIDIIDTALLGKTLLLDGVFMLTDKDEFIYHDMLVHIPMFTHPEPRSVLIVGGGDGGSVREVVRHPSVERIEMVELDRMVVEACKTHFPALTCALDDPRLTIHYADGIEFVKGRHEEYDVILVDSTDPIGPAIGLFSESFYADCHRALKPGGVLTAQIGSPFFDAPEIKQILGNMAASFPIALPYTASVPTYPGGYWCFGIGSKGPDPRKAPPRERYEAAAGKFLYYNPEIHEASFVLPNYFREALEG